MNLVALTPAGESHPVMQLGASARRHAEEVGCRAGARVRRAARRSRGPAPTVLAVAAGAGGSPRALVAVQRYGEGRAMVFTGEAAWRWRMLLPSSDRSYDTFWRQALDGLRCLPPIRVALALPASASTGEPVSLRREREDAAVRAAAEAPRWTCSSPRPGGRVERLRAAEARGDAGEYVARFTPDQAGVYRVSAEVVSGRRCWFGDHRAARRRGGSRDGRPAVERGRRSQRLARRIGRTRDRLERRAAARALQDALRAGIPAARLSVTHDLWNNGVVVRGHRGAARRRMDPAPAMGVR